MNSKLTCKTCGKENVPDWNGKGQCITCSRDEVLGVNSPTDTNQASEDELTYGVDLGIPGGDFTALSIKKGSTLFTFVGDEAVAIIDLIRTEKLKLLAEVRERVVGEDELYATDEAGWGIFASNREKMKMHANKVKSEQRAALTKLEAEL